MESFAGVKEQYDRYVDGFRGERGELPPMMRLKYEHTMAVVENSRLIADGEAFEPLQRERALLAGLLHDTGRYEQLRRYNTFRDSDSVDHAVFSHSIVKERGWCSDGIVLLAVLYHNRRELPTGLDADTKQICDSVRDADKLDIFHVLEDRVENTDWRNDATAFWNLRYDLAPNPAVVAAVREGRPVDYQNIKSLADFVLIQVGWMIAGLCFATSRRICFERGHLDFRRRFLREIGGGDECGELCDLAARRAKEG